MCMYVSIATGLPCHYAERNLRQFFSTRYSSGGGPIEDVFMHDGKAVITFTTNESETPVPTKLNVHVFSYVICLLSFYSAAMQVAEKHRSSPLSLDGHALHVTHMRNESRRDVVHEGTQMIHKALFVKVRTT